MTPDFPITLLIIEAQWLDGEFFTLPFAGAEALFIHPEGLIPWGWQN